MSTLEIPAWLALVIGLSAMYFTWSVIQYEDRDLNSDEEN